MYKGHDHRRVNQSVLEFIIQYNLGAKNEPVTYLKIKLPNVVHSRVL